MGIMIPIGRHKVEHLGLMVELDLAKYPQRSGRWCTFRQVLPLAGIIVWFVRTHQRNLRKRPCERAMWI